MKEVLVDTSVIIDFLRRKDKTKSLFYRFFSKNKKQPVIALVTVSELWAGKSMRARKNVQKVEELLEGIRILLPDLEIAKITGEILRETDYKIAFQDAQIAAFAKRENLAILTLNQRDFRRVKGLRLAG